MRNWKSARSARDSRLQTGARYARGKLVAAHDATALLEAVLSPGDRVCLEGDSQKAGGSAGGRPDGGRQLQNA
jgi:malonate decarboxylase alpha subunit